MPRRNNREVAMERQSAEILGPAYRFTRDPDEAKRRAVERARRREESRKLLLAMPKCLVPDCPNTPLPGRQRDDELPVCWPHAVEVWSMVQRRRGEPEVILTAEEQAAERQARDQERVAREAAEEQRFRRDPHAPGEIYFVKVNGLIKVGWSGTLWEGHGSTRRTCIASSRHTGPRVASGTPTAHSSATWLLLSSKSMASRPSVSTGPSTDSRSRCTGRVGEQAGLRRTWLPQAGRQGRT